MPISPKKRKNGHPAGIFREIFVSASRDIASFGLVFVFEPENFEQKKLGTLFGIIKISDTSQESSFVANLLASVIKKEYFSKPDRPAEASFEAALRKANFALAELARQGSVKWTGKIHFAGGILEKNNLHFSKLGTTAILLLRSGAIADIGAGMGSEVLDADSHPLKTFSDISSGKVEKGDCLILTTDDLLEIFSLEEIRQNAARFSRDEFPDILSASLTANSELSGAIVVNLVPEEIALLAAKEKNEYNYPFPQTPAAPETDSPEKQILQPEKFAPIDISPAKSTPAFKPSRPEKIYISESDEIIPKKSAGEKISLIARNVTNKTGAGAKIIWRKTNSLFSRIEGRKILYGIKSAMSSVLQLVRKIDWRKKNVQIGAAGIIILAVLLLVFKIFSAKNSPAQPATVPEQTSAAPVVLDDINVKNIENISEVAALPADSRELLSAGDALFSLSADKSILKINPAGGETEKIDSSVPSGKFLLATEMPDLNTFFILTADKKVISFTPSNKKFQENGIALPDNLNAADVKTYLTYIYFLDSTANQIYRYPRAEGGFGDRQDWLKSGADVKNSVSFAINEDLFVADRGQITAYLQGKKDGSINFEDPTVPLAIDKIYSTPDLENIYILDNKNHRIATYSKDGKIVAQYFNNSISAVKDFTVDEKNKSVYLLKNDGISKFNTE